MTKKYRNLPMIITILAIITMTCNLPTTQSENGSNNKVEISENEDIVKNEVTLVKQESFMDYPREFFFMEGTVLDSTEEILFQLFNEGYDDFGEGGMFEYSNGIKMHAMSIIGPDKPQIILMEFESPEGLRGNVLVDLPEENVLRYRDISGTLTIVFEEDGTVSFDAKDSNGNPINNDGSFLHPDNKIASLSFQTANVCRTGMIDEFINCLGGAIEKAEFASYACIGSLMAAFTVCETSVGLGCPAAVAAALASCGLVAHCTSVTFDDPPTFDYDIPKVQPDSAYRYCLDKTLVEEVLYEVKVDCKDDRSPQPNDLQVVFSSGDEGTFACTDCSGQSTQGTLDSLDPIVKECSYGCLVVGDGKDRCLAKNEEIPDQNPVQEPSDRQITATGEMIDYDPDMKAEKNSATLVFPLAGGPASAEATFIFRTSNRNCPDNYVEQHVSMTGTFESGIGFDGVATLTGKSIVYDANCKQISNTINNSDFTWMGTLNEIGSQYVIYLVLSGPNSDATFKLTANK